MKEGKRSPVLCAVGKVSVVININGHIWVLLEVLYNHIHIHKLTSVNEENIRICLFNGFICTNKSFQFFINLIWILISQPDYWKIIFIDIF